MKLLLDMYRSAPKEQRDKVQLMAAEKKSKAEVSKPSVTCHPGENLQL
jgi:E3 ubiquitin-protein ligase BRE1